MYVFCDCKCVSVPGQNIEVVLYCKINWIWQIGRTGPKTMPPTVLGFKAERNLSKLGIGHHSCQMHRAFRVILVYSLWCGVMNQEQTVTFWLKPVDYPDNRMIWGPPQPALWQRAPENTKTKTQTIWLTAGKQVTPWQISDEAPIKPVESSITWSQSNKWLCGIIMIIGRPFLTYTLTNKNKLVQ